MQLEFVFAVLLLYIYWQLNNTSVLNQTLQKLIAFLANLWFLNIFLDLFFRNKLYLLLSPIQSIQFCGCQMNYVLENCNLRASHHPVLLNRPLFSIYILQIIYL